MEVVTISTPPEFAHVCPHIYRSGDPTSVPGSISFLKLLKLRSIVLLSIEHPSNLLRTFCEKNNVKMYHFGIERRWPTPNKAGMTQISSTALQASRMFMSPHEINSFSVLESITKDALELLLDIRNHPILVTDIAGIFETGTLLGCLRKMQGWNILSILVEYRGFAGSLSRTANERFIEMFDTDLVTLPPPEFIPDWLLPSENFTVERPD
ncbi:protein-tyrosine-phosphatase [Malassezia psittaci]|uniref:Protein-tyrosine-phosphatase n=1 Tax=Malassezia psittaci TaxID=1821823 RepID=A0AAF0F4V6_9BASI|nr:protein-tyrosine-phosphatase [Malassezia psittaci]